MMRNRTWSNIGTDVKTNDPMEALRQANLDYTVSKQHAFYYHEGELVEAPNDYVMIRDDGHCYGAVKNQYVPCQNRDAFEFLNTISDDIEIVKAGETEQGMIYLIGRMDDCELLGDKFTPYVIFRNSHNGSCSLSAAITPLRIVCENQFAFAFGHANNKITIKHSKNIDSRIAEGAKVLLNVKEYMESLTALSEELVNKKMTTRQVNKLLDTILPLKANMTDKMCEQIAAERDRFKACLKAGDNQNFKGTAWGVVNAYSDYLTHEAPQRKTDSWESKKFERSTFGADTKNFSMFVENVRRIAA